MDLPSVDWATPENMPSPFRDNLRISLVELYGSVKTYMIVESSTKQYPTREIMSPEMLYLKTDP